MEIKPRKFILFTCFCVLAVSVSKGQDTACLNQLVPCLQYINSNHTPSTSCCKSLKSLINSDPGCLCTLLGSTTVTNLKQAGVNTSRAIQLPKRCGEKVNASLCKSTKNKRNTITSSAELTFAKPALTVFLLVTLVKSLWILN